MVASTKKVSVMVVMQEFEQKGANQEGTMNHLRVHIIPLVNVSKTEEQVKAELDKFMKE